MSVYRDKQTGLWRIDFWLGRRRWTRRGLASRQLARDTETAMRREIRAGTTAPTRTFAELVNAWLTAGESTKTAWRLYTTRKELERAFGHFGPLPADAVTRAMIEPVLGELARTRMASTVNSYRRTLHAVCNYGVATGWMRHNPVHGIPPMPEDEARVEPIPTEHLFALVAGAPSPRFAAKLTFVAQTGCRWVEMARLEWADYYADRTPPVALLTSRKNRRGAARKRPQPLTAPAVAAIESVRGLHPVAVFVSERGTRSVYTTDLHRLMHLCDRLKLPRYSWHQIRHWAGMRAVQLGKSRKAVADFLGHSDTRTTERYLHALGSEVQEIADHLAAGWVVGPGGGSRGSQGGNGGQEDA